jgi:HD-like signal output (HDOD) protein
MNDFVNLTKAKTAIINKVKGLPTLPDMVQKVLTVVQDDTTSGRDLAKLVAYDQAISSRLIKVANSAYYGFMREIATVPHAIVVLGFEEVRSLVLGIAVFDTMGKAGRESSIVREEFWLHSVGSALAHDIGKLVLDSFFPQEYAKAVEKVRTKGVRIVEAEEEVMGFSHADVGGWLCERWKFPPSLLFPVSFHHCIEKAEAGHVRMTAVVHFADSLCRQAGIGSGGDESVPPRDPVAKQALVIKDSDLEIMLEQLLQEVDKAQSFLSAIQ